MNKSTDFYVNKGLQHIDDNLAREWQNFVEQWHAYNGHVGLYEMTSILERLSNKESFSVVFNYCKTIKIDNNLLNVMLSFAKRFEPRVKNFIIYWNMKNNEYNQYNIEFDDELKELNKKNISLNTAYSLKHGVSFDDILSIFEVTPNCEYKMLEEIVNSVSTFSKRGKEFKTYFYENGTMFLEKSPNMVKVKK